jgi:glycosyltransferase involved in cell wall biosynthesis
MELFFVKETISFSFTDSNNLQLEVNFYSQETRSNNQISANRVYFTGEKNFQGLKKAFGKMGKENMLNLLTNQEKIYSQFLSAKEIRINTGKNVFLPPGNGKIALLFDLQSTFEPEFNDSLVEGLNYFYGKLANHYKDIQLDVFTLFISKWLVFSEKLPLTNLYLLPDTLEKLVSYDSFLKLSEIVNEKGLLDKGKIDDCLKNLGVERSQTVPYIPVTGHRSPVTDLVTIIIPTYNRENFLPEAVESVLNQTYKNFELIIVDDGSTDNTAKIAGNYLSDPKIQYIYQENGGISAARNKAIRRAKGKFLMFLDDDDFYLPFAVEKLLTCIQKKPGVKFAYGDIITLQEGRKILYRELTPLPKPQIFIQYLTGNNITTPGQVIAETQAIKDIGLFNEEFLNSSDYELWTRLVFNYEVAKIDLPVTCYRKHNAQVTSNRGRIRYFSDKACLKFWYLVKTTNIRLSEQSSREKYARFIEKMAISTSRYSFSHYDTALEMLMFAQEICYSEERDGLISYFSENISKLIKEEYDSDLRITQEEKADLIQKVKIT